MPLPCTVYSWSEKPDGEVAVVHLVSLEELPSGMRVYRGNDEKGDDWQISSAGSDVLPMWIHTHPPAKKDIACPTCERELSL